jgi:hypothetical protein
MFPQNYVSPTDCIVFLVLKVFCGSIALYVEEGIALGA